MAFSKPNVNIPWGFEAGSGILEPLPAKIAQGWVAEIPDFEYENWIQNRQDRFNAHVNERGIPEWDSSTEYLANKSYVQGSDGLVYRALTTNTNKNPTTSSSDWVLAFDAANTSYTKTQADDKFLLKSANLDGLTNKATARSNLSVYSKSESDAKYQESSDLSSMIVAFPVESAPSGWLPCNGAAVSRTTYPTLFARIGTAFGSGDGSTTFNVPDLRGEFIRGWDDGRGIDSGRTFGSPQSDGIKSHSHTGSTNSTGSHSHTGSTNFAGSHSHGSIRALWSGNDGGYPSTGSNNLRTGAASQEVGGLNSFSQPAAGSHSHTFTTSGAGSHSHTFTTSSTGGSETRPRNIAMMYCIKT